MGLTEEEMKFLRNLQKEAQKDAPKSKIVLYDYQEDGVNFITEKKRCILADEMGLGKTYEAIFAAEKLQANRVLIICPNTLKHIWERELESSICEQSIETITSNDPRIREEQIRNGCRFTIMNYEQLGERVTRLVDFDHRMLDNNRMDYTDESRALIVTDLNKRRLITENKIIVDERHLPLLCSIKWDMIIFDEAHKIKNNRTTAFKAVKKICEKTQCPNVVFMTGTPILNRPGEIWTLLHCIDPDRFSSLWSWETNECYNRTRFRNVVSQYLLRREKKDVLSLPDKTYQNIEVDLEGTQKDIYNSMQTNMYAELEGMKDYVEVICRLAQIIRLKQIAVSADLLDEESDKLRGVKIDILRDLLESAGDQKVVIFSQFARVIRRLTPTLKEYNPAMFTGADNNTTRKNAMDKFQKDKSCKVFLSTIQAGGVGITLTEGNIAIFTDHVWTPAINGQAADRIHRIGQTKNVQIISLIAKKTIEEHIQAVLRDKEAMFSSHIPVSEVYKAVFNSIKNRL